MHAIARDKKGKILAHTAISSGALDYVFMNDPIRYMHSIKTWADRVGAAKIDVVHNHPSGYVKMSKPDKSFAWFLKHGKEGVITGLGDRMGEFIVIDHGKFSFVPQEMMKKTAEGGFFIPSYQGVYEVIPSLNWMSPSKTQLREPSQVARFASALKYDKNKALFIYVDNMNNVRGWTSHDNRILMKSPEALKATVIQQTKAHNARRAVIISSEQPLLQRIVHSAAMKGDWLLDLQTAQGLSYRDSSSYKSRFGLPDETKQKEAWGLFEPDASGAYEKDSSKVFRQLLDVIEQHEKRPDEAVAAEPPGMPEKRRRLLKEDVYAVVNGMQDIGIKRSLERVFKSPEWYDDPRQRKATEIAVERSDWFHENFNSFNEVDDPYSPFNTVSDAMVALGRKGGIGKVAFIMGKRSRQYRQLKTILDEADVTNKVYTEADLRKKGIDEDVIHVWKLIRQSYDKQLEAMQRPMRQFIAKIEERARMEGKEPVYPDFGSYIDKNGKRRPLNLKEALMLMGQYKGSYAPRIREPGEWVVQARRGLGEYVRYHRRTKVFAKLLANKLKRQGFSEVRISPKQQLLEETFQLIKPMEIQAAINRAMQTGQAMGRYDADVRMALQADLLTAAADLIKSRGARSAMIARRRGPVVRGYITDPIERTVRYMMNNAAGMAKARAANEMFRILFGEVKGGEVIGGVDQAKEPQVHRALREYIEEQLRNPEKADRVIGLAKSIATFKYLGFNPRSIMVNVTSLVTTTPVAIHQYVMGGKGSLSKIGLELSKASLDYIKVMRGEDLTDPAEQQFIQEVRNKGYTDPQYTREAVGHIQGAYGMAWSKAMGASMWGFGKSEEWVRGSTMLAGFRLARKAGKGYVEAVDLAKKASDKAHGIYGKATYPAWAQGTGLAARVGQTAYVYAKFPHNALQMYYDVGVKKKNIKGIIYALAAPAVLGGAAAFPMKDTIIAFINGMLKAAGIRRDAEKFVYDTIREQFGEGTEKQIRGGVLGEFGIDISGSLSMGPGALPHELLDLTGAIGGVSRDIGQAWRFIETGQASRSLEFALPRFAASPLQAIRELNGATTRRGYRIWDEKGRPYIPKPWETKIRVVGFRSARRAALAQRTWEAKREKKRFDDWRSLIYEKYRAYIMNPTPAIRQDVWEDIDAFNRAAVRAGNITLISRKEIKRLIGRMHKPTKAQLRLLQ